VLEGRAGADENVLIEAQRTAKEDVRIREVQGRRSTQAAAAGGGGGGPRRGGGGGRGGRGGGGGGGGGSRFGDRGPQADHVSIGATVAPAEGSEPASS
jgi:hypothetical protein